MLILHIFSITEMSDSDTSKSEYDYEPEWSDDHFAGSSRQGHVPDYLSDSEDDTQKTVSRLCLETDSWCSCGKCCTMPTEKECLCCHEMAKLREKINEGTMHSFKFLNWLAVLACINASSLAVNVCFSFLDI